MQKKSQNDAPAKKLLAGMQKRIYTYAAFAGVTIILTVVLLFAVTTAWYTNVVKTGNLVFQAAAWGFNGTVELGDRVTKAAPGDSGVVPITMENTGEVLAFAGVNVSKEAMTAEMQQRIYFYVDAPAVSQEETVERVYLHDGSTYPYVLLENDTLTLTETTHNGPQLKWMWVYDVLGYYFRGTKQGNTVTVESYLRPVQYDYDAATFQDGQLETVDGETTVAEFLLALSQTDGYKGTIDPASGTDGDYPVDVDADGKGVWLHLCSWAEIELATHYDTTLGEKVAAGEAAGRFEARITVYGQQEELVTTGVDTQQRLLDALAGKKADYIRLENDIALNSPLLITDGRRVVVDLNGYTLSYGGADAMIQVEKGSDLTLRGGTLDTGKVAVQVKNSKLLMSEITAETQENTLVIQDGTGADSCVRLRACQLTSARQSAVSISGNGTATKQRTQLTVEDCLLTGERMALMGSADADASGTSIQVLGSTLEGKLAAIYHPQSESMLVASDSTLTGGTAVVLEGGSAVLTDCTVQGTGAKNTPAAVDSGFTGTGDGIYVENAPGSKVLLEISGNSNVSSRNSLAIQRLRSADKDTLISVTGGKYSSDITAFLPVGYQCIQQSEKLYVVSAPPKN